MQQGSACARVCMPAQPVHVQHKKDGRCWCAVKFGDSRRCDSIGELRAYAIGAWRDAAMAHGPWPVFQSCTGPPAKGHGPSPRGQRLLGGPGPRTPRTPRVHGALLSWGRAEPGCQKIKTSERSVVAAGTPFEQNRLPALQRPALSVCFPFEQNRLPALQRPALSVCFQARKKMCIMASGVLLAILGA